MTDYRMAERLDDAVALSPATFARFAGFITGELGIKMPESKTALVQSRLLRRVRELKMQTVEQYGEYFFASAGSEEREQFINAITTNKTDFFREPEHLAYLRDVVLPAARTQGRRYKVWSAGCSSGEEPYTLAMILAEHAIQEPCFDFAILGTDVSTKVLGFARNAVYQESQVAPVPPALRGKYLLRSKNARDRAVRVAPGLRKKVSLHQLNFMDDNYCIRDVFDVVFFRNVMIYFDRITQEAVIDKICRNLAPGGYLFAGHSESLTGLNIPVRQVRTAVYRKPA